MTKKRNGKKTQKTKKNGKRKNGKGELNDTFFVSFFM